MSRSSNNSTYFGKIKNSSGPTVDLNFTKNLGFGSLTRTGRLYPVLRKLEEDFNDIGNYQACSNYLLPRLCPYTKSVSSVCEDLSRLKPVKHLSPSSETHNTISTTKHIGCCRLIDTRSLNPTLDALKKLQHISDSSELINPRKLSSRCSVSNGCTSSGRTHVAKIHTGIRLLSIRSRIKNAYKHPRRNCPNISDENKDLFRAGRRKKNPLNEFVVVNTTSAVEPSSSDNFARPQSKGSCSHWQSRVVINSMDEQNNPRQTYYVNGSLSLKPDALLSSNCYFIKGLTRKRFLHEEIRSYSTVDKAVFPEQAFEQITEAASSKIDSPENISIIGATIADTIYWKNLHNNSSHRTFCVQYPTIDIATQLKVPDNSLPDNEINLNKSSESNMELAHNLEFIYPTTTPTRFCTVVQQVIERDTVGSFVYPPNSSLVHKSTKVDSILKIYRPLFGDPAANYELDTSSFSYDEDEQSSYYDKLRELAYQECSDLYECTEENRSDSLEVGNELSQLRSEGTVSHNLEFDKDLDEDQLGSGGPRGRSDEVKSCDPVNSPCDQPDLQNNILLDSPNQRALDENSKQWGPQGGDSMQAIKEITRVLEPDSTLIKPKPVQESVGQSRVKTSRTPEETPDMTPCHRPFISVTPPSSGKIGSIEESISNLITEDKEEQDIVSKGRTTNEDLISEMQPPPRTASPKPSARNEGTRQVRKVVLTSRDKKPRMRHPALIESLFPNVPPVLKFVEDGQKIESLPWEFRRLLRWRASLLTPIVVKQALMRSGFRVSKLTSVSEDLETVESSDWIFYFGKHMRPQVFRSIRAHQKVNHLPCSFQLGRKDRLWKNLLQMQNRFGKETFGYMPQTFCLPTDLEALKTDWEEEGANQRWILKPPASARGIGVRLITKWAQVPKKRPAIVQRYLSRPFLINESKFDLRIYVYISSINPLRVYIHEDGLVRFASQKYTNSIRCLGNRFIHLTNYSINRLNSEYVSNTNDQLAKGHKWSLRALWAYLSDQGISPTAVWSSIKDVVVKTAISTESAFNTAIKTYCRHSNSVHEMFGFDIFLDEDLQPWLLEVNVSPSMHSDSPLDAKVKGTVIKDMLNIAGLRLPEASDTSSHVVVPLHITKPLHARSNDTTPSPNPVWFWNSDPLGVSVAPVVSPCDRQAHKHDSSPSNGGNNDYKGSGDVEPLLTAVSKKTKRPSHEWVTDNRLYMTELSVNEIEKRRYYINLASQFELPKPHPICSNGSTPKGSRNGSASKNHNHQPQKLPNKPPSKPVEFGLDEFTDEGSVSSDSSLQDLDRDVSSPIPVDVNLIDLEDGNNSSKKPARSLGIGPSSPNFKSYRFTSDCDKISPKPPASSWEKIVQNTAMLSRPLVNTPQPNNQTGHVNRHPTTAETVMLPRERIAGATADILSTLTPSDVRILVNMVDELERAGGFECVFPPSSAELAVRYLSYFEAPRYANLLCVAYLQKYAEEKEKGITMLRNICENKVHLKSALHGNRIPSEHIWNGAKCAKPFV